MPGNTSAENQSNGSFAEDEVMNLLAVYNPVKQKAHDFFDVQVGSLVVEIKSVELFHVSHKRHTNGRITFRPENHKLLKKYCEENGLTPVYWIVLKINNNILVHCLLDFDKVTKQLLSQNKSSISLYKFASDLCPASVFDDLYKKTKDEKR